MAMVRMARAGFAAALAAVALLAGCDNQRMEDLKVGISTEVDVRDRLGPPEYIWPEADGSRTLEYNRQPMGATNYMINIGTDGKMRALDQVLTPQNFAKVQPGMSEEQVRRMLGKPAKVVPYELKQTIEWDWNWIDPPTRKMYFTVVFGYDRKVKNSYSAEKLHDGP